MPRFADRLCEIYARVVGVLSGVELGAAGGVSVVISPQLVERGVVEDVAVGGIEGKEVEGRVTCGDYGDEAGDEG